MKRYIYTLIALFVFMLSYTAYAAPAPLHANFAPVVGGAQMPPIVVLDGGDNTFVSAVVHPQGCVLLSYIDRDDGNRLKVKQDAGTTLIDVPLPAQPAVPPSFTAPGDKQADGQIVIKGGQLLLYYTSRGVDDPSGSFGLRRLTIPLPNCM